MRKVFIILLVLLAAGAVGMSVYFVLSKEEEHISDTLYDAVPLDAGLIIDIRQYGDLCNLMRENGLWEQLCKMPAVESLSRDILLLDSLAQKYEAGAPFRRHVIFSLHPVGKEETAAIGYVRMSGEKEAKSLTDKLKTQLTGKAVVSQRVYDQINVAEVAFNDKNDQSFNISCAYRNGIFVFSRSSILLESALRQISADHNITHGGKLSELMRTAGKSAPANIYINYDRLPRTALAVLHDRYRKLIEPLAHFADWTELDLNLKSDMLLLNGFTAYNPGAEHRLEAFLAQPSLPVTLTDAMPSTTYAFFWMGVHKLDRYFADYGRYLERYKETARKKELNRINNTFRIDLQKDFEERFEDEAALVCANVGQTQSKDAAFALFRIKSTLSAVEMAESWQDAIRKGGGSTDKERLQFDHQLSFTAYRLPFDVPAILFGDVFAGGNNWCVVADNYIVFGDSPANLKKYLNYTALHSSLQTDLGYGKLVNHFSTRCNIMFYCNPSLSAGFVENMLRADKFKESEKTEAALSRMQAAVYQLNITNGMLYNNVFLKYLPATATDAPVTAGTQTSWESLLDTAISFKPQLIRNHSTGETEIFVQDMADNIYLLNNVGRILWKAELPEPILSPVHQIDFYRNGKLQMLFSTKNYLYVIDRLGKNTGNFPVKLKSPATGGVALFDYDNDRKYRMMIACEDRKVYAYEKTGKPVDGWGFGQSEHPVQTDIYHYRVNNKDYVVFADKYRVYILDRQGRTRVSPERNLPVGNNTVIALDGSRLVLADTTGTVHFISLTDGMMTRKEIKTFPASHFFVFQDTDGDRQGDFIYASGNRLEVFRQDGKQIVNIETGEPLTERPYVYEFGATDLKIGIVQPQSNQIWLYNGNGKVHKGFPLKGSTLFSIGRLDKNGNNFNLFVGSKNNFLYNYAVN